MERVLKLKTAPLPIGDCGDCPMSSSTIGFSKTRKYFCMLNHSLKIGSWETGMKRGFIHEDCPLPVWDGKATYDEM